MREWEESIKIWNSERKVSKYERVRGKYRNIKEWEESIKIWNSERKVSKYKRVRGKYWNINKNETRI